MPISNLLSIGIPIKIIETERAFYVDRRISNVITFMLITLLLGYILRGNLQSSSSGFHVALFIVIELFLYFFYLVFWQFGSILVIQKPWINETKKFGLSTTFYGNMPANVSVSLSDNPKLKTEKEIYFERSFILF